MTDQDTHLPGNGLKTRIIISRRQWRRATAGKWAHTAALHTLGLCCRK